MLDTDKEIQILDLFQEVKPLSDYVSDGFKKVKKKMSYLSSSNEALPETFLKVQLSQLQEHDFNEEIYPSQDDNVTVRQVMESILTNGFDGVITCTKGEKDRYIIVSGHIRFRALTQLVKEGHLQFNEVMISLKEFKSIQDEMMYIMDMNNAKRTLNDVHRFRSIGIYLGIYRSNPDSDSSKRSEIQFLCDKLNLSERQIYKYLSIYKENEGDVEKAIIEINKHGSINKTAQFYESQKVSKKIKEIDKVVKTKRDSLLKVKMQSDTKKCKKRIVEQLDLIDQHAYEFNGEVLAFLKEYSGNSINELYEEANRFYKTVELVGCCYLNTIDYSKKLIESSLPKSEQDNLDWFIKAMIKHLSKPYEIK